MLVALATLGWTRPGREPPVAVPFLVGEQLTYVAKVNFLKAGSATMSVKGIDVVRGTPAYHTVFELHGRVLFKSFNNHYESWFDTTSLSSLRQIQDTDEGDSAGHREYEFDHARRVYIKNGVELPGVAEPSAEGSFLYFRRALPLTAGATYTLDRYYHADRNPIVITVERRERITVPAGTFDAIVVHPVIKSHGLFSATSQAEVWIADNPQRTLIQLKSKLSLGTLYLYLTQVKAGG